MLINACLVSNGQQEKKVTFPLNPHPPPPPILPFSLTFYPTRAISCFVSSMERSDLYLNVSKAERLFIAYSSRVADWLIPIPGNKTTLNDTLLNISNKAWGLSPSLHPQGS